MSLINLEKSSKLALGKYQPHFVILGLDKDI